MGVGDDAAAGGLPEDLEESDDGDGLAVDQIPEDGAGPDGRKLVDVADEEEGGGFREGSKDGMQQRHIDHGGLVDDEEVGGELVVFLAEESARTRVDLQESMDGLGGKAGGFRHAPGGTPGRRGKLAADLP